jgi:hypothetical protein
MIVHFHVGRSHAPIDAACFRQSITIEGLTVYENGRLMLWDHPVVEQSIKHASVPSSMLENNPIPLV